MVLVVDDEKDLRESVKAILELFLPGVRVEAAPSGQEALEVLGRTPVDLILTDYKMPGMDGLEFLRAASKIAPGVPRLMITAFLDQDLEALALGEGGAARVIRKPIDPDHLVQIVQETLPAPG